MFARSTVYVTIMNKIPHIPIQFFPNIFYQLIAFEIRRNSTRNPPNAVKISFFKAFHIYKKNK